MRIVFHLSENPTGNKFLQLTKLLLQLFHVNLLSKIFCTVFPMAGSYVEFCFSYCLCFLILTRLREAKWLPKTLIVSIFDNFGASKKLQFSELIFRPQR